MNRLLFLILASFLLSSCSTYYVSKLNSPDLKKNEETGAFTFENDSLSIGYSFFGENAPVQIDIFNKMDEPLYIDWQRSALIVDDQATSYMGDNISINGSTASDGYSYRSVADWRSTTQYGAFNGTATMPRGLSFIPPKSRIEKTQLELANLFYEDIADSSYSRLELAGFDGATHQIKVRNYTTENSPLHFRSYLTLYTLDEVTEKPKQIIFEQNFYVNQVSKLGTNPENLLSYKNRRGDIFYNKKTKGRNATLITAAVAIGALGAAVENEQVKSRGY